MATTVRHGNFHNFAQRHFTDTNVLIYCLLLFFLCLLLAVISNSDNLNINYDTQQDLQLPSDKSPAYVPIPADQGSSDNLKLRV